VTSSESHRNRASGGKVFVNEVGRIWKEVVVVNSEVETHHLLGSKDHNQIASPPQCSPVLLDTFTFQSVLVLTSYIAAHWFSNSDMAEILPLFRFAIVNVFVIIGFVICV